MSIKGSIVCVCDACGAEHEAASHLGKQSVVCSWEGRLD